MMDNNKFTKDISKYDVTIQFPLTIGKKTFYGFNELKDYVLNIQDTVPFGNNGDYYTYDDNGKYIHVLPFEECVRSIEQRFDDLKNVIACQRNMLAEDYNKVIYETLAEDLK